MRTVSDETDDRLTRTHFQRHLAGFPCVFRQTQPHPESLASLASEARRPQGRLQPSRRLAEAE
jgi:hypothetical protein